MLVCTCHATWGQTNQPLIFDDGFDLFDDQTGPVFILGGTSRSQKLLNISY